MKYLEKNQAITLRIKGQSITKISKRLNVSKSSVSTWVRNIKLDDSQLANLKNNSHSTRTVEKRRESRLKNEDIKRSKVISKAQHEVRSITYRELWLMGTMLYWAEGGKTQRQVRFSNGDPEMIKIMMHYFRDICKVPEEKFRGYIHIRPHLDHISSEKYWAEVTGIPKTQFFKTYRIQNKSSQNKKDTLPKGVLDIYVLDVSLFLRIYGWSKGIFESH